MPEELQSLLDKINEEGVKKAEARAAEIIANARKEARAIQLKAEQDAAATAKAAQEQAEALQKRAESAVRQASRDIVLELQQELEKRMNRVVAGAADQALTPEFMAGLIRELAAKFAADPGAQLTVLTAVKDAAALDKVLAGALVNSFHASPRVIGNPEISGGMEVSFRDGRVYFDFTAEAVTDLIAAYVGPRLAKLLAGN